MTVYIDSLFLTNFFMDSFLIFSAAIMRRKQIITLRIFMAGIVSALYGVLVFFPELSPLYGAGLRIFFSAIPVLIGLKARSPVDFLVSWIIFLLVTAASGGVMLALASQTDLGVLMQALMSNFVIYVNMSPFVLLIGCIVLYCMIEVCKRGFMRNSITDKKLIKFDVRYMGTTFSLTGIIDTGCELCEPLSGAPMIVAEKSMFGDIPMSGAKVKINTAGGEAVLDMIIPEWYETHDEEAEIMWDSVIALSDRKLSGAGKYNALINPLALEKKKNNKILKGNGIK